MSSDPVRVRFAPSPTGYLHIGGARSALYNYLFAKKYSGDFIYRVEDTDLARSTEDSMHMQIEDMQWLGLDWSEGPEPKTLDDRGAYGPYRQSQRLTLYHQHAEKLVGADKAYYCFCSDALLEEKKERAMKAGQPPHYDGTCRVLDIVESSARVKAGEKATVRFKVQHKDYVFQDAVRGEVSFPAGMVGDFIVLRSDGMPVYNFCCVVDDAMMKISHVLRAEEHLSNTLRQLMLYEGFGYTPPLFGHLSIILDTDRQKMSKRRGATSCHEFKMEGYLPEALLNFIALLGWSSPEGQEIMTMSEMIQQFSLDRLHAAAAVFDETKLRWVNATHLRALPLDELWRRVEPFLGDLELPTSTEWRHRALELFKTSMERLVDAVELFTPLSDSSYRVQAEAAETLGWESTRSVIQAWHDKLQASSAEFLTEAQFVALQDEIKNETGARGKFLFMPIRVAVIGKPHGAELKILVPLMARQSLIHRALACLQEIK
jgi:nondiscriminating glutamyl-tRNA synthetase